MGILFCFSEGDVGMGMVVINSVRKCMGNVLVGMFVFVMIVLDKKFLNVYLEIDLVIMLNGSLVVMVYVNNCLSDLNVWFGLFCEFLEVMG